MPENLKTLTFGICFNQNIENILNDVKYINFDYRTYMNHLKLNINKINNIPRYFYIKIFLYNNIFDCGSKWPIHVVNYDETKWSSDIYEIIDKHIDPIYGNITVLINKETYEPYSHAKSALK